MSHSRIRSKLPAIFGGSEEVLIPEPPQRNPKNPDAPPPVVAHRLDFVKLGLPEYENRFAIVIDNLFTPEDCARYVAAAEASKEWEVAAINVGPDAQYVDTSYRNSSRILYDDHDLVKEMFEKLKPHLSEIAHTESSKDHRRYAGRKGNPLVQFVALNERLRFLKYGPGQFFRSHCDGTYATPDGQQVSYFTLQLYLNGSAEELQGGATRFWKSGRAAGPERRTARPGKKLRQFVDVPPRVGRALIFEQAGLVHSGEDVKKGMKLTVRTDLMYELCPEEQVAETPV